MDTEMKFTRCSNCLLPTNIPGLTFDQDGKCNICQDFESHQFDDLQQSLANSKREFEAIIQRIKGRGKYDCVMGLSGGKDSSYLLYILVKDYGLKPLVYNFDNGYRHPQAVKNIENLVNKLGVDLVTYKPDQTLVHELYKTFLLRAGEFCTPCNMLIDTCGYRFAQQNGIKVLVAGAGGGHDPGLVGISTSRYYDRKYYLEIAGHILTSRDSGHYIGPSYPTKALRRLTGQGPYNLEPLNFMRPSLKEIDDALLSIGWERPADVVQHGDCLLNPLKEYIYYKKWGCNEVTGIYSILVRNKEINREDALKLLLAEENPGVPDILPDFLKAIHVTESEFLGALKKDFRKIPNIRSSAYFTFAKSVVAKAEKVMGHR